MKDGTYDLEGLKKSILSDKGKVPAVTVDKVGGKLKLWEGQHRVAAAHELGDRVPAVILEKKKDYGSIFATGEYKEKRKELTK